MHYFNNFLWKMPRNGCHRDVFIVNYKFCTSKLLGDQLILFILSNMIILTRNFGGNCRLQSVVKDFDPGFEQLSDLGDVNRIRELQ